MENGINREIKSNFRKNQNIKFQFDMFMAMEFG